MDSTMVASVLASTALTLLAVLYYRYKNIYSFWDKLNVVGPKPKYVVGHLLDIFYDNKTGFVKNCVKKYGRVYGAYEGIKPSLMVIDVDVALQICIKDFDFFPNHKDNKFFSEIQKKFVFSLRDDEWRRVRALLSPTFTSAKMRRMAKILDLCADDLVLDFEEQIAKHDGQVATIELKKLFAMYTTDAITSCCYALKLKRATRCPNSEKKNGARSEDFVDNVMDIFKLDLKRLALGFILPEKILDWTGFEIIPSRKLKPIVSRVTRLIEDRKKSTRKVEDYLQSLIDARLDDEIELDEMDDKENHHAALTNESIKNDHEKIAAEAREVSEADEGEARGKPGQNRPGILTADEILANAALLMVVGQETTANLLTNCIYSLAFHNHVQEKLRKEIQRISAQSKPDNYGNTNLDYDSITSSQYLDAVICETLRILCPLMRTDREGNSDYYIEKYNITLPKGTRVSFELAKIMTDEEYWTEPYKFDPERFMPGRKESIKPGTYCPFGLGPRHCLGMRFSLTEAKIALAKIIVKFQFEPAPKTKFPPELAPNFGLRILKSDSVNVRHILAR